MFKCAKCAKGSVVRGKRVLLRGHYNPVEKSRKYPNLQWARLDGEKVRLCTRCIRTSAKAVKVKAKPAKAAKIEK
jgi:ribosomal protein L28